MFRIISIILIVVLLSSCYHENKPVREQPDPLLTEGQMVEILTDIQLAEGIMAFTRLHRMEKKEGYKDSVFNQVFTHYNINSEILAENMDYYNFDPELMGEIYEKVLANLSKLQSETELESKERDSIFEANED